MMFDHFGGKAYYVCKSIASMIDGVVTACRKKKHAYECATKATSNFMSTLK